MEEPSAKVVLWRNLTALMRHHWGRENQSRLSQQSGVGLATVARLKAQETSVGLEVAEAVAGVFKLPAWQLLYPGLEPTRPPQVLPYSPMAVETARVLDAIDDPYRRGKLYAVFIQLAEMGRSPTATSPPEEATAPTVASAPTQQPLPATTAKRTRHR